MSTTKIENLRKERCGGKSQLPNAIIIIINKSKSKKIENHLPIGIELTCQCLHLQGQQP